MRWDLFCLKYNTRDYIQVNFQNFSIRHEILGANEIRLYELRGKTGVVSNFNR